MLGDALDIVPFQWIWLLGTAALAPVDGAVMGAVQRVDIDEPDDAVATFSVVIAGHPDVPEAVVGARAVFTAMFGAFPRVLLDGFVTGVSAAGGATVITGEDRTWLLAQRFSERQRDGLASDVARDVLRAAEIPGATVVCVPPPGDRAASWRRSAAGPESDRAFVRRLGQEVGAVLTCAPGLMPLSCELRWAPLAMRRMDTPPLRPDAVEQAEFFSPSEGVRVGTISVLASGAQRFAIRGVHDVLGFGGDSGQYYAQHIAHEIVGGHLRQRATLVRVA